MNTGKTITILLLLSAIVVPSEAFPQNQTYQNVSEYLWDYSGGNETIYINNVMIWTFMNIKQTPDAGCSVRSPERTMIEQKGDCSEYALLMAAMLKQKGIDARVVHGYVKGEGRHNTVELHIGNTTRIIDSEIMPTFEKYGDWLFPCEYVY